MEIPKQFLPMRGDVRVSGIDRFNLTDAERGRKTSKHGHEDKKWVLKNNIISK